MEVAKENNIGRLKMAFQQEGHYPEIAMSMYDPSSPLSARVCTMRRAARAAAEFRFVACRQRS